MIASGTLGNEHSLLSLQLHPPHLIFCVLGLEGAEGFQLEKFDSKWKKNLFGVIPNCTELMYWPSPLKRRPGWKGVDFCLSYRCLNAPSRWGLYVALGLIAVVFGLHVAFPMRYFLTNGHWWQPIIAFALLLSSVSSLMMTHLTDPGIIPPRPPPPASWLQKHAKGSAYRETVMDMIDEETGERVEPREDDVKANAERILQTFYARGKIVPSGTPQLTSVYCYTCHNWRTPRTVHCSDCGVGTLHLKACFW